MLERELRRRGEGMGGDQKMPKQKPCRKSQFPLGVGARRAAACAFRAHSSGLLAPGCILFSCAVDGKPRIGRLAYTLALCDLDLEAFKGDTAFKPLSSFIVETIIATILYFED